MGRPKERSLAMIPLQLTLQNFLSYREATLDFRGLQTACICGPNGAGKSSLLEAIGWCLWGNSRAVSEEDVIHLGTDEAQVDFIFQCRQQIYRVIRTRRRRQGTALEFQVATESDLEGLSEILHDRHQPDFLTHLRFRPLTEKSVRATQQVILQHLKLDYETFINSAYLRQGRADEFMLKRPSERKQILADLLKLDQYDILAEQAKEKARQFKAEVEVLSQTLVRTTAQLESLTTIAAAQADLEAQIAYLQEVQERDRVKLQTLQAEQHQRQTWQQQRLWQQQQQRMFQQDCQRLRQEHAALVQELANLESLLHREAEIEAGYAHWRSLQQQEEIQSGKLQTQQILQEKRQQLQQQFDQQIHALKLQLQQADAQQQGLVQQEQDLQQVLSKSTDIEAGLNQLNQARARLRELDQLQLQVTPLIQRQQALQNEIEQERARLVARLEELQRSQQAIQAQQQQEPQLQQALLEVSDRIEYLERRQIYLQRVREKGLERRSFVDRLQAHQRDYERQLAEIEQKLHLLSQGIVRADVDADTGVGGFTEVDGGHPNRSGQLAPTHTYPPCPLCHQPLDEPHWQQVMTTYRQQQQELQEQIWVIREQLVVSEREIQVLRQEYREVDRELSQYGNTLERKGQLSEQLTATADLQTRSQQLAAEITQLTQMLEHRHYALDRQAELAALEQTLQAMNYDDRNHALARGEVERWRWAEIKQAELQQAQRRHSQIAARKPVLEAQIANLNRQIQDLYASSLQASILDLNRQILELQYDRTEHNQIRAQLRQAQAWQLHYRELQQAKQQYPHQQRRLSELAEQLARKTLAVAECNQQLAALTAYLEETPDPTAQIQELEYQSQQRRSQLDHCIVQLGRLQQQQQQLTILQEQQVNLEQKIQTARQQQRIYEELAQAFGKNGIQALMIENLLPQLEAEANHILARLSANQLHVQFITQRAKKRNGSGNSVSKLIDTLDILIADTKGTRPYETYSGGEAFRINFAIRLALARLLAQRSGMNLQMLIVDEGFGTQDDEGCDRLIAAINAIAADFACILTITHMPRFKEAFQSRIEVQKTAEGSKLCLL
ncbi:AAA family ATPase [Trichothermofontia sichuanensis B231]|uniref:AAA family ATPase n=1 Tax=Trichothermofontia sichuanensis TaxID=3045816 RepID=UPI00224638D6|nr:AAA family ATPase [Trichothermofontia sichuanensis B231]